MSRHDAAEELGEMLEDELVIEEQLIAHLRETDIDASRRKSLESMLRHIRGRADALRLALSYLD